MPSANALSPLSQNAARPSAGDAVRRPRQYRYAAVAHPTIGTGSKLQSSSGRQSMPAYEAYWISRYTAMETPVMKVHCSRMARACAEPRRSVPRTCPMTRLNNQAATPMNSASRTAYYSVATSAYVPALLRVQLNWYISRIRTAPVSTVARNANQSNPVTALDSRALLTAFETDRRATTPTTGNASAIKASTCGGVPTPLGCHMLPKLLARRYRNAKSRLN